MTSNNQQDTLAILAEIWALSPDVRLGQLFAHLGFLGEAHFEKSLGYIEDEELIEVLELHREELLARVSGARIRNPTSGASPSST